MAERSMYLTVDELWRLANACRPIEDAFGGNMVWLVGSVLERPDYRDVDLRVILDDEHYDRLFIKRDNPTWEGGLLDQFRMLMQTAMNVMLKETTGLTVDFQIQSQTEANGYNGKRNPVSLRPYICEDFKPQWMRD